MRQKIGVIGDGSWATALIHILSQNDQDINWWIRKQSNVDSINKNKRNPSYISSVSIDTQKVTASSDINEVVNHSDILILVVPAAFIKEVLDQLTPDQLANKIVVSAIKGMMPEEHCIVTEYLEKQFSVQEKHLTIIAGPCHAEEVALNRQSYLTIGCNDQTVGEKVANLLRCNFVNVHCEEDLVGIEYAAVMKNIVALCCGICHGLNLGDNFQAVLVSNAMNEIRLFLNHHYPNEKRNVCSSAYLGDLLVTCYSQFSRNRSFGNMIGRGYSVKNTMMEMNMIAEGYYAVKSIHERFVANKPLSMPITEAVFNVLYAKNNPSKEMNVLKELLS